MGPEVSSSQPYCPPGRLFRDHATQNSFGYLYLRDLSKRKVVAPASQYFPTPTAHRQIPSRKTCKQRTLCRAAIQIPPWGPEEGRAMRVWALVPLCNMS